MDLVAFAADILGFQPKPPTAASTAAPPVATRAPAESPWAEANNATKEVSAQLLRHEAWRRKYPDAAQELDDIAEDLNTAIDKAKPPVAAFPGKTIGPFNVAKHSIKKGCDPALLSDAVRELPGVLVLTVDVGVVNALVKCGQVAEADVAPARTETIGAASVRGPQKLVVKP